MPESIRIGAPLRTGVANARETVRTFQIAHACCCARTRVAPMNVPALLRATSASVMNGMSSAQVTERLSPVDDRAKLCVTSWISQPSGT